MFDYINTKYEDAELIINYNNPNEAILKIKNSLKVFMILDVRISFYSAYKLQNYSIF